MFKQATESDQQKIHEPKIRVEPGPEGRHERLHEAQDEGS